MPACDILIIGSGVAGCACALAAADAGLHVVILTNGKDPTTETNTSWAQGGIIYEGHGDSPDLLAKDIHAAGAGICNPPAVEQLSRQGPRRVESILLERCQIPFDRNGDGTLNLTEEAAHSLPRIIHVGDHTGSAIAKGLWAQVRAHANIEVVVAATAVDLIMTQYHTDDPRDVYLEPRCLGAYVLRQDLREIQPFVARETVLATGGLGQIYLHTTNPTLSRGDGLAMAYRAGARVMQVEYVQFHPTAFYHEQAPRFLLTESLRGEGARLVDAQGREFMKKHHELGTLAPRDVVARAIQEEMLLSGEPCMYLDISHRDANWVRSRFPMIQEFLQRWDFDLATEPIPVVPAAHYACGGVAVDLNGRTSVRCLRAAGEVACTGLHGANRLASTSLLEGLVWGYNAAQDAVRSIAENHLPEVGRVLEWKLEDEEVDPALIQQDWMTIKQTMWNYVGLVRNARRMNRALQILRQLQFDIETFYRKSTITDDLIGLRNGAQAAIAVTHAAFRNRSSLGGHYRTDASPRHAAPARM